MAIHILRREVERCDNFLGIQVTNSVGGASAGSIESIRVTSRSGKSHPR